MGGKINLFNLGALGIDLVKSPLHITDGAWRLLQNAEFSADHAQGAIKKRASITPFSAALAGTVQAILNVPLPISGSKYLLVALNTAANPHTFKKSIDGTTYTNLDTGDLPLAMADPTGGAVSLAIVPLFAAVTVGRQFFYAGDAYVRYPDPLATDPPLVVYDGVQGFVYVTIPPNPADPTGAAIAIMDLLLVNGAIYLATWDSGGALINQGGRVLRLDPGNGTLTQIGNAFGDGSGENGNGTPYCLANYQGRLWAGTWANVGNNQGKVYSILAGIDDAWTAEHTATLHNGYVVVLCPYNGKLYAGTDADSSGTAVVLERDQDGNWTTSLSAPNNNVSWFAGAIVFGGNLYMGWYGHGGTATLIKKFDGTTWSTAKDVAATYAVAKPGRPFIFRGDLYWPFGGDASLTGGSTGFILKLTSAGVWSRVLNGVGIVGGMGQLIPEA